MQCNRVRIPPKTKETADCKILINELYWEENGKTILGTYVVKTSKEKKNVLMLSTMEPILGVTKNNDKIKPLM